MKKNKTLEYDTLQANELTEEQATLINKAKEALKSAYAPYSNFQVGTAIRLDNGEIITGSNQENAAYPSGLCAERVAIFAAHHQYPKARIEAIALAATDHGEDVADPVVPCAACLQVMTESVKRANAPFEVILSGTKEIVSIPNVLDLLPFHFEI